ncbi:MAG: alpha/beta fold hydrolase [Alcanivorax sp.]|nr:alpha/beta fold hydrolase [Alcanivorax sp.]
MPLIVSLLILLVLVTTTITVLFYLVWYFDRRNFPAQAVLPGGRPLHWWGVLVGMAFEAFSLTLLVVSYPLRLIHDVTPARLRRPGETPVILVHGYGGNSANLLTMQWRLRLRGWSNVYSVGYTPPHINARKLAAQVNDHVLRILEATGADKAHLICHSMGGPLTRYALKNLDLAGRIDKVITLGSPHQGSRIAALFPARGAAAQMRYQSPFIRELDEGGECPGGARFYAIFSDMDNFVLPVSTAMLKGAEENILVPYLGHCALLFSNRVLDQVERCLLPGPKGS